MKLLFSLLLILNVLILLFQVRFVDSNLLEKGVEEEECLQQCSVDFCKQNKAARCSASNVDKLVNAVDCDECKHTHCKMCKNVQVGNSLEYKFICACPRSTRRDTFISDQRKQHSMKKNHPHRHEL
mmetsp:Transcript_15591/g.26820  ORF Transcript_15591/g.26820 Transcript_15591/m.26820 type:complete len:126 (+) Transcript_15591:27-404(+)